MQMEVAENSPQTTQLHQGINFLFFIVSESSAGEGCLCISIVLCIRHGIISLYIREKRRVNILQVARCGGTRVEFIETTFYVAASG